MASAEGLVAQLDALLATTVAQEAFDKLGRRLAVALTGKTERCCDRCSATPSWRAVAAPT